MPSQMQATMIALAVITAACAAPIPSPSASAAAPSTTPVEMPSTTPTETCPPSATGDEPAQVTLLDANGKDVAGYLGSYTFCGKTGAAASPWDVTLPTVTLSSDQINVVISADNGPSFVFWTADYAKQAPGTDGPGATPLAQGASSGSSSISFAGPPAGTWLLGVDLVYASELGGSTWYWRVTAP